MKKFKCSCGKSFLFDKYNAHKYQNRFICPDCFSWKYGYCNDCGELFRYDEMNDDIICRSCEAKNK